LGNGEGLSSFPIPTEHQRRYFPLVGVALHPEKLRGQPLPRISKKLQRVYRVAFVAEPQIMGRLP
jgi:hypothetical protein